MSKKDELKKCKTRKMTVREFIKEFPGRTIPAALTASGYLDVEEDDPLFNLQIMRNKKDGNNG